MKNMFKAALMISLTSVVMAPCFAADEISGVYGHSYQLNDKLHGRTKFGSSIEIKKLSLENAFVHIKLNEATAGSSCGGDLDGVGRLTGNKITLTKTEGNEACVVLISIVGNAAHVTSEDHCSNYHGAGCSFDEAASNLRKVTKSISTH